MELVCKRNLHSRQKLSLIIHFVRWIPLLHMKKRKNEDHRMHGAWRCTPIIIMIVHFNVFKMRWPAANSDRAHNSLDNEQVANACNGNTQSDTNNDDNCVTKAVGIRQDAKTFKRYASCVCAPNFSKEKIKMPPISKKEKKDDFCRGWHFTIENWFCLSQPATWHDNTRISFRKRNRPSGVSFVLHLWFGCSVEKSNLYFTSWAHDECHVEYRKTK